MNVIEQRFAPNRNVDTNRRASEILDMLDAPALPRDRYESTYPHFSSKGPSPPNATQISLYVDSRVLIQTMDNLRHFAARATGRPAPTPRPREIERRVVRACFDTPRAPRRAPERTRGELAPATPCPNTVDTHAVHTACPAYSKSRSRLCGGC